MTPADLRAKAETLMIELGESREYYARDTSNKYALKATQEAYEELAAFVAALISVMHEASELTPGPGCMCDKCACYRTALYRLEELTK